MITDFWGTLLHFARHSIHPNSSPTLSTSSGVAVIYVLQSFACWIGERLTEGLMFVVKHGPLYITLPQPSQLATPTRREAHLHLPPRAPALPLKDCRSPCLKRPHVRVPPSEREPEVSAYDVIRYLEASDTRPRRGPRLSWAWRRDVPKGGPGTKLRNGGCQGRKARRIRPDRFSPPTWVGAHFRLGDRPGAAWLRLPRMPHAVSLATAPNNRAGRSWSSAARLHLRETCPIYVPITGGTVGRPLLRPRLRKVCAPRGVPGSPKPGKVMASGCPIWDPRPWASVPAISSLLSAPYLPDLLQSPENRVAGAASTYVSPLGESVIFLKQS